MIDGAVNVLTDDISISRIGVPWLHSAEQRPQRHHPQLPLLELHAPPAAAAPARRETLEGRNRPGATEPGGSGGGASGAKSWAQPAGNRKGEPGRGGYWRLSAGPWRNRWSGWSRCWGEGRLEVS